MVAEEELVRFWEDVPLVPRVKRNVLQDVRPVLRLTTRNDQRIHSTLLQVMASSSRLEQKLDHYLWIQTVLMVLVLVLTALWAVSLYIHYSAGQFTWTTAKY